MHRHVFAIVCLFIAVDPAVRAAEQSSLPLHMTVTSSDEARADAIVVFDLPSGSEKKGLRLVEITADKEVPVTVQLDQNPNRLYWVARGATAPGTTRRYRLDNSEPSKAATITAESKESAIELRFNDQRFLQYNRAHVEPSADLNPLYGRSAHLHPVRTPKGTIVTDEFPPDHAHQSGIFLAFTKTKFDGQEVDFWNLAGGKGRVRSVRSNEVQTGPLFARFTVEHEHVLFTPDHESTDHGKTGGIVALTETWDVRAWTTGWESGYWSLDVHSQIRCATDKPLILPEYHYGGMAIRAAREWIPDHVKFVTSEGADRIQGNHTRPRWCDISGQVGGMPAGVTLMTHPTNFRFPEPLRIHPTMPYMVYAPSFLGEWSIQPGTPHSATYRFLIHDGELPSEAIENVWRDFAKPLVAKAE